VVRARLLEPVLAILGFVARPVKASNSGTPEPDFRLYPANAAGHAADKPLALCLAYTWGRNLDGKDELRDNQTPDENPGAVVVTLLDSGEADWAIVTNGKTWRLYSAKAHSRATNYYEIDLEETLAQSPAHLEYAFRYFWLFFRSAAFIPADRIVDGEKRQMCFLDSLMSESERYARELGERLKERVFFEIFPHFARGFIIYARRTGQLPANLDSLDAGERNHLLEPFFSATLTFLYRLLFLLYAESRDLLPVREVRGYHEKSLERLKRQVAEKAGTIEDQAPAKLKVAYTDLSTAFYDRLQELFDAVDEGDAALNVPVYNGGLFMTQPDPADTSAEADVARFLAGCKIPDRELALGLDLMARDMDEKRHDLAFIDYKSLGVRQLGSIYEGLLEFKLRVAPEVMALVKGKKTEEVIPYAEAQQKKLLILKEGRGKDAHDKTLPKGAVYLENDRRERKATGSYYTPDYIVKYIVEHTVGPVLTEKLEALRPIFREAEKTLKVERDKAKALGRKDISPENETYKKFRKTLNEALFDLKVLDPAMGSGHFLVEAVDYITDQMAKILTAFKWNPIVYELAQTRHEIQEEMERQGVTIDMSKLTDLNLLKRRVLKSCIYGVDLNPMAVELAKVSLWLDCFTLGAPLSFLDHHMKCGNSLIGGNVQEVQDALSLSLWGNQFTYLLAATELMRKVGELSDVTAQEVAESRKAYKGAYDALAPFKRLLHVWISEYFGNKGAKHIAREYAGAIVDDNYSAVNKEDMPAIEKALTLANDTRFFHWDLEFPEVFFDETKRKENGGFDAVVGNPPYGDVLDDLTKSYLEATGFPKTGGRAEVYSIFVLKALRQIAPKRLLSFIIPNTFLDGAQFTGLRRTLSGEATVKYIKDYRNLSVFEEASVQTMIVVLCRTEPLKPYSVPYEYWDINAARFNLEQLWVAVGSDLPWHIQNSVIQRVSKPGLCISLEPGIGTCHDAGVDYKWKGVGWQSRGEKTKISDLLFYEGKKRHSSDYPLLKGADIDRYSMNFDDNWLIHDFAKYKTKESVVQVYLDLALVPAKILSRQTSDRIQACADYEQCVTAKSIHTTIVKAKNYNLLYVISVLNSRLLSYVYQLNTGESGRLFAQVKLYDLRELPIRYIKFTTLPKERGYYSEKAKNLYEYCLSKDDQVCVLGFVDHHLSKEPEESDVVHDLLVFLAEEMIRLNKEKREAQKEFLDWLVTTLRILPDKEGRKGIDVLTGKGKLADYPGDYQKGESPLAFEDLLDILQKNKGRLGVSLSDAGLVEKVRKEYEGSLERVLPLKERLAKTDALIDQVVYRLYGLTEEEIKIVEGRG
jgi:TaqI-like C-terminal specificity domain/Eco57I restriction-modification methylase